VQTWAVLSELGFNPDDSVMSDIQPGLSFDFGNLKLTASAVLSSSFQQVVLFVGTLASARTMTFVEFEMPRQIESHEACAAWLAWKLDQHAEGFFQPRNIVNWLKMGRENRRLLPWVLDKEAYDSRPHCIADKELARPMLKHLAKLAEQMPPEEKVWFSFDGEVLKIRVGKDLLAVAARGELWTSQYGLDADQLTKPLRRMIGANVCFEYWEDEFAIGNCRLSGVSNMAVSNL